MLNIKNRHRWIVALCSLGKATILAVEYKECFMDMMMFEPLKMGRIWPLEISGRKFLCSGFLQPELEKQKHDMKNKMERQQECMLAKTSAELKWS
jgi:hypothetical protein